MTLRRRLLLAALAASAWPLAAGAQRDRVHRIGMLLPVSGPGGHMDVFYRGLRELGYVEGKNLVIERRYAEGRDDRYAALAAELVKLPVDILLAAGPSAVRAARAATDSVPIVMGTVDPIEQGLIASLARPGGNITGWSLLSVESAEKQVSLLKEAMPHVSRAALISNPRMAAHGVIVERISAGAQRLGIRLASIEVSAPEAIAPAFAAMARDRAEAFLVLPEPVVLDQHAKQLTSLAAEHRLPGLYQWRFYVQAGGLMSYGPRLRDLVATWPTYVDKILKGAKPADLPVETPRNYELVLNQRTASALGFTFPPALRLAADEIIS